MIYEDFTTYPADHDLPDGAEFGFWRVGYTGYGTVRISEEGGRRFLTGAPRAATAPEATHAFVVLGPRVAPPYRLEADVRTRRQLRQNSPPNTWEVGWVVWGYEDDDNMHYFAPKTNGWEIGRVVGGRQEILYADEDVRFDIGIWHRVDLLIREDGTISVHVNGDHLVDYTSEPSSPGDIGLYSEDALVDFDNIRVTMVPRQE